MNLPATPRIDLGNTATDEQLRGDPVSGGPRRVLAAGRIIRNTRGVAMTVDATPSEIVDALRDRAAAEGWNILDDVRFGTVDVPGLSIQAARKDKVPSWKCEACKRGEHPPHRHTGHGDHWCICRCMNDRPGTVPTGR